MPADPSERFIKELSNVFRESRERVGLSQKALALRAKIGRTGIITFEQGTRIPSGLILHKLATGLELKLSDLVAEAEGRITSAASPKRKRDG